MWPETGSQVVGKGLQVLAPTWRLWSEQDDRSAGQEWVLWVASQGFPTERQKDAGSRSPGAGRPIVIERSLGGLGSPPCHP